MPRSHADRNASLSSRSHQDRNASLSRASIGKGSLGRFSVATDLSASSVATRHWVNSVSDIYGPDEIEELLQDLNRLELATFDTDDFQDFDIDGSQLGGLDILPADPAPESPGHRSRPPSPSLSIRSWDSHTHYQQFKEPPDDYGWGHGGPAGHIARPLHAAVCYCDIAILKTPRTLLRVLVLVTSLACLSCVLTAGTAKTGLYALPHFPKLRLIIFVAIFSVLFCALVIFLNISHLHALIPMDYAKMQTVIYLILTVVYMVASSLVLYVVVCYSTEYQYTWIPAATSRHLIATTVLGYICSLETLVIGCHSARTKSYDKMEESSTNFTLHEANLRPLPNDNNHLPRPPAPPAPKPIVRSRAGLSLTNRNYQPAPALPVQQQYSNLIRTNTQHNNQDTGRRLNHGHVDTWPAHVSDDEDDEAAAPADVDQKLTIEANKAPPSHSPSANNWNAVRRSDIVDSNEWTTELSRSKQLPQSNATGFPPVILDQFHPAPYRETGAIPKKKKPPPLPSPAHPDEIISLPLDDMTPSPREKPHFYYAH